MRLPWGMAVSSGFLFFVIASVAKQSMPPQAMEWIASSRSLSSGAHSRDPLAPRNDDEKFRQPDYTPPG
jgi:hypothetical protein